MAQLDDIVGAYHEEARDMGEADNTIVVFTTDNGAETFTWPDGGNTPFKGQKGTVYEGGFRVPCIVSWPGISSRARSRTGCFLHSTGFPRSLAAAGDPNITDQASEGREDR